MKRILKMDSVQDYNDDLGVETLHPLVSVVDMSELEEVRHSLKRFGFYCVILKQLDCGQLLYGQSLYDYREGTLVFIAPGQVAGMDDGKVTKNAKGWILMFHPDLILGTSLKQKMVEYSFFDYASNEALHLSEQERETIIGCMKSIREELNHCIDKHTKQIIAANIELLLNYCVRFYDRQFVTREVVNKDVILRFESLLDYYFASNNPQRLGLPTVSWCAGQLCLSPNYFGDLIKKETGRTAQEYLQQKTVQHSKLLLDKGEKNISEIAYQLGFKYPHHLTRMFKRITGYTPTEYRMINLVTIN